MHKALLLVIALYTKTGLVFGFSKNQILVAVIPGLENAEDFTRAKLFSDFPENNFEMSTNYFFIDKKV
jgi:hypothetical protein